MKKSKFQRAKWISIYSNGRNIYGMKTWILNNNNNNQSKFKKRDFKKISKDNSLWGEILLIFKILQK